METTDLNSTTAQAIADFYEKNNFNADGGAAGKYAWIKFGFFSLPIPNTESRRNNIQYHDMNHIATGFDTDWKGESAVAAWEVASGGWKDQYVLWFLTLWAMGLGVTFYPKNVLNAFQKGLTMNNTVVCGLTKEALLKLPVGALRNILTNQSKRKANVYVWMFLSFLIFAGPALASAVFIGILILTE